MKPTAKYSKSEDEYLEDFARDLYEKAVKKEAEETEEYRRTREIIAAAMKPKK